MSGHSHYATIKRQKGLKDAAKGQIFSKLAKAIQIAVKAGGGGDPDANYKLRMAVDTARAANMPKDNIERAISRAASSSESYDEVSYEGFGPGGIGVIIDVATDNRNRTSQEIKNLFERGGGSLAGPGAVSFNFELKGLLTVKKEGNAEELMLKLIDAGVEDMEEQDDAIEVYVQPDKLTEVRDKLSEMGLTILSFELVKKPKSLQQVGSSQEAQKIFAFLDTLESHDDVQKVYTNIDIPEEILKQVAL